MWSQQPTNIMCEEQLVEKKWNKAKTQGMIKIKAKSDLSGYLIHQSQTNWKMSNISRQFWKGKQINCSGDIVSRTTSNIFEQLKQAINSRDSENLIEEYNNIFDDSVANVRGMGNQPSWNSLGFTKPSPLSSFWSRRYSPRYSPRLKVTKEQDLSIQRGEDIPISTATKRTLRTMFCNNTLRLWYTKRILYTGSTIIN